MFSGSSFQIGSRVWGERSTCSQHLPRRQARVDHLDLGAVAHDLFHRPLAEVERAEDAVAVLLVDDAFGVADGERARDLLAHGEDVAVGVGLHAEEAEDAADEQADDADDRREDLDEEADERRDAGGHRLGPRDREGLGQHLAEDQDEERHPERGEGHARSRRRSA